MKKVIKLFILTLFLGVFFVACNSEDNSVNDNKGTVYVKITDAPFPINFVSQANVGIAKVELKNQNNEYVTVFEGDVSYNMVNLTNGVTENITINEVETGTYVEARVTLNDASIHLSNGTIYNLTSDAQGSYNVTINPPLVVEDNEDSSVLLDLDLNNSFDFSTNTIDWITDIINITGCEFNAVFRACDLDQTGKIDGIVKKPDNTIITGALVSIDIDGNTVSTLTDSDGEFTFIGIKEGNYTIHVETQNEEEVDITGVHVTIDNTTSVNATLN
jgi:hypothetical protein